MRFFDWLARDRPVFANLIGWQCFQVGLFFLASSAFISGIFLLVALSCGSRHRSYLRDFWNYPFLLAGILMILGSLNAFSQDLAWLGLANWLPLFWAFWGFQPYLTTADARRKSALLMLGGTLPVLITGFGQLWLGWEGPWHLFDGLIIWFVTPGGQPNGRLSGLFDYANIAGAWLAMVWPFALAALLQPSLNVFRRLCVFLIAISIVTALVLTDSRNAWGGLIAAIPFVVGPACWSWLIPLLFLLLMPIALAVLPGVSLDLQQWARKIVPEDIWARLNDMRYINQRSLASTRLAQWEMALQFIGERPWLGWGAAAFSVLYPLRTGQWHGHSHNLPLEIAVSHGWPVALLIVGTITALLIRTLRVGVFAVRLKKKHSFAMQIFDRSWWTASFILFILHAADIPFFDSRLNIAGWILMAGLRSLMIPSDSINEIPVEHDLDVPSMNQA